MTLEELLNSKINFPTDNGEIISWYEISAIELQFKAISQNIDFINESISQEQKKLEAMASEFIDSLNLSNNEEKSSLYHCFIQSGGSPFNYEYSSINSFPQIQWRSQFLVIYSYFEHILNYLCLKVQKKSNFELGFKDMHGKGIERSRTYLVKLAKVDAPFRTKYWQRAKFLSAVRNIIAHNNSLVKYDPSNSKSPYKKIEKEGSVNLQRSFENRDDAELILTHDFLKQSAEDLKSLVLEISSFKLYSKKT